MGILYAGGFPDEEKEQRKAFEYGLIDKEEELKRAMTLGYKMATVKKKPTTKKPRVTPMGYNGPAKSPENLDNYRKDFEGDKIKRKSGLYAGKVGDGLMKDIKRKMMIDILASYKSLPFIVAGTTLSLVSWATDGWPTSALWGIFMVLAGGGIMGTRFLLSLDKMAQKAFDSAVDQRKIEREKSFDDLYKSLYADGDSRDDQAWKELREVYGNFRYDFEQGKINSIAASMLVGKIDEAFDSCVSQLKRSYELSRQINDLLNNAELMKQREDLMKEILDSVDQIKKAIQQCRSQSVDQDASTLQSRRSELERAMRISAETEKRLSTAANPDEKMKEYGITQ